MTYRILVDENTAFLVAKLEELAGDQISTRTERGGADLQNTVEQFDEREAMLKKRFQAAME